MKQLHNITKLFLAGLLLSLVSTLTVGCGDSEDFVVAPNNNGQNAATANLTFQFVRPQAIIVPDGTTRIGFDLYSGPAGTGDLLMSELRDFATEIKILNASVQVQSVVITAYGPDALPLANLRQSVDLVPGDNLIDLSQAAFDTATVTSFALSPDPLILGMDGTGTFQNILTLSIGSPAQIPSADVSYVIGNGKVANVTSDGTFMARSNGNTSVTATYTFRGAQLTDEAQLLVEYVRFFWDSRSQSDDTVVNLPPGGGDEVECDFFDSLGRQTDVDDLLVVTLTPPVEGFTVVDNNGKSRVNAAETVDVGTSATVRAVFTDPASGRSFTQNMTFNVVEVE